MLGLEDNHLFVLQGAVQVVVVDSGCEYLRLKVYLLKLLIDFLVLLAEGEFLVQAALDQNAILSHDDTSGDFEALRLLERVLVDFELAQLDRLLQVEH